MLCVRVCVCAERCQRMQLWLCNLSYPSLSGQPGGEEHNIYIYIHTPRKTYKSRHVQKCKGMEKQMHGKALTRQLTEHFTAEPVECRTDEAQQHAGRQAWTTMTYTEQ